MRAVSIWKQYQALNVDLSGPSKTLAEIRLKRQHLQSKLILANRTSELTVEQKDIVATLNRLADEEDRLLARRQILRD